MQLARDLKPQWPKKVGGGAVFIFERKLQREETLSIRKVVVFGDFWLGGHKH